MQMDSRLAATVIRTTVEDEHRAIAAAPGVDLATVVKYALAARSRQRVRDAILAVLELFLLFRQMWILAWILAWIVVFTEILIAYYGVVFPRLRREVFDPDDAPLPADPHTRRRLADIAVRDRGNVTVFSDYAPFAGYGSVMDTWSFALNVAKPEEGKQVLPFRVHELYDHVAAEIGKLTLPGVSVEDRLFINGLDLLHGFDPHIQQAVLPDPMAAPVARLDEGLVKTLRDDPASRARPYLAVSVTGWSAEVTIAIFLRFVLLPHPDLLFIEASYSVLPPSRVRYTQVDRLLARPTARQFQRLALEAAMRTPATYLRSVPTMLRELAGPLAAWSQERRDARAIQQERTFNYGAHPNPRELATDNRYHRYFQKLDEELYVKTVEHRIMDAITDFLIDHNVDVSDLIQRQTTILNNGIYVSGQSQVTAQNMAAGAGAVARTVDLARQGAGRVRAAGQTAGRNAGRGTGA